MAASMVEVLTKDYELHIPSSRSGCRHEGYTVQARSVLGFNSNVSIPFFLQLPYMGSHGFQLRPHLQLRALARLRCGLSVSWVQGI